MSDTASKYESSHSFHPSILREYDIRGIVGETLSEADAYFIGKGFGTIVQQQGKGSTICVSYDGRISSPMLKDALSEGLQASGIKVIDIGLGPTPQLYFSVFHTEAAGGIMITGSHNPPNHNGFKIMIGQDSFYGKDIQYLGELVERGSCINGEGSSRPQSVTQEYLEELVDTYSSMVEQKDLKIAWDAGNGATGRILEQLCQELPGEHITLFTDIDGTFPNHHPDPTVKENLVDLIETVQREKCDFGIAFDGDGDRLGVVDAQGNIIWGDQLMMLYAFEVLDLYPGATIIADVKASQALFDKIKQAGGKPLMWKTGHSLIKTKMKETGAPLAGEMSGHMFFHDEYYGFDDGLYAAVRLLRIVSEMEESFDEIVAMLPQTVSTPEIRIDCDEERKFIVVEEIKKRINQDGATFSDVDGVRVTTPDGWWLLRASNTQAALVARCESDTHDGLERLKNMLTDQLGESNCSIDFE